MGGGVVLLTLLVLLPHHVTGLPCQVSATHADCRGRDLSSVPSDLPPTLTSLDLSRNKIRHLGGEAFARLSRLVSLSLRHNSLSQPLDFRNGAVFRPLVLLRSLDLGENQLTEVANHSFSGLPQLQRLLLDHNLLQRLQPCAFCGLAGLRHLQLQANRLCYGNRSIPPGVFSPLLQLTTLDLSQNSHPASTYPDVVMTSLTRLESLTFDLLPDPLPEVFTTFTGLTSLTLNVFRWTCNVSNETFSSLAEVPLQRLQLSGQDLHFLHRDAFQPVSQRLQQLEVVDLPSLSLPQAIAALHVFRGRNMSVIRLEGVSKPEYYSDNMANHAIDEESGSILNEVCAEKLVLARNSITVLNTKPFRTGRLKTTLKYFDFSGNYLALTVDQANFLVGFRNIEHVDFSTGRFERVGFHPPKREMLSNTSFHLLGPNLQYLNISHCLVSLGKLPEPFNIINGSRLRTLDISYCGVSAFSSFVRGIGGVKSLNVSGNDLGMVNPGFMDDFPEVKEFSLRQTGIDQEFLFRQGIRFFRPLTQLEFIDLSENRLSILPRGIFLNAAVVILSMNAFSSIPLEVDAMPRLVTLDLTFNSIAFLSSQQRNQLDARAQSSNGSFRLLLEGNPLSCDCSVLDFVSWLSSTSVRLDRGGNYSCIADGGDFTTTAEVAANLDRKWRECVGSWWLGMSSSLLVVTLMTLVLAFLVSRFWTNVQHVVLRLMGFGHALFHRADFRYDVYVAYSDEDYRFACLDLLPLLEADGLRVYVRDRDEPVGESRAEEVVRAVGKSWCIVFLLTEAFLRDEWCQFTALTAARCSASPHGPGRVLLVLLRPLPRADLPPSLLTVVEEQDVFDLGGEHPGPALWGRLLHRIREE